MSLQPVTRLGSHEIYRARDTKLGIVCGGVLVIPGDVILAGGDGVLVVPRAHGEEVARYARKVIANEKAGRGKLDRKLGLPPAPSVR